VKQRDKQKIEKIMRQRTALSALGSLARLEMVKQSDKTVREPSIEKRNSVSIAGKRMPTFYWGI
jgi:hypothetical protein